MTTYTIAVTSSELTDITLALRSEAAQRRRLAETCGDIAILAEQKTDFAAQAERLEDLASRLLRSILKVKKPKAAARGA